MERSSRLTFSVLAVDDSTDLLTTLRIGLPLYARRLRKDVELVVLVADTESQALNLLKAVDVSMALVDVELKANGNSEHVCEELENRHVPFYRMTGISSELWDNIEFQGSGIIQKPLNLEALAGCILNDQLH